MAQIITLNVIWIYDICQLNNHLISCDNTK
jgi:hypothetical protein